MGDKITFKRLFANGDPQTGLSDWGPVTDDVVEGDPQQRYHYVEDAARPNGGVTRAGVWEATQYTCWIDDYPCCHVLLSFRPTDLKYPGVRQDLIRNIPL